MAKSSERKPPHSDSSLEPRVDELELQVAALTEQVEMLEGRVQDLEDAPPVTEPPPTEPPPAQGGEDIIKDGKTLSQLCAAGGTVELPGGIYHGTTVIGKETTVIGQGSGSAKNTILTCEGIVAAQGKAMFAANAPLTLRGLVIRDVTVPDHNGAAVRTEPGINLTMEDCEVMLCQDGILTAFGPGGVVTVVNCNFHDNGAADGQTHEVYFNDIESATCTDSDFVCGMRSSHAVKSRAKTTTIRGCRLAGSPETTGAVAGSTLDLPDGGEVLIENTQIEGSPGHPQLIGYAMENQRAGIKTVTLRGVHLVSRRGAGEVSSAAGGTLVLEGCTYSGTTAPQLLGWTSVQGQLSARSGGR